MDDEPMTKDNNDTDVDKMKAGGANAADDFESDLQMSASAFEALERDFQEVSSLCPPICD